MSLLGVQNKAQLAAANNADLCAAIFAAHGLVYDRNSAHLYCEATPPPLYPTLVTLTPDYPSQLPDLQGGAIKDSFSTLDAAKSGLHVLFDASWIWRDGPQGPVPQGWARVTSQADFSAWREAWGACNGADGATVFPDACLDDPNLVFLGRWAEQRITGGCLVNISASVVGLSNVFSRTPDRPAFADAAQAVSALADGKPVVGYESGPDLAAAIQAGFEEVGPLRVLVPWS